MTRPDDLTWLAIAMVAVVIFLSGCGSSDPTTAVEVPLPPETSTTLPTEPLTKAAESGRSVAVELRIQAAGLKSDKAIIDRALPTTQRAVVAVPLASIDARAAIIDQQALMVQSEIVARLTAAIPQIVLIGQEREGWKANATAESGLRKTLQGDLDDEIEKRKAAELKLKDSTKNKLLFVFIPCLAGFAIGLVLILCPLRLWGWGSALCGASVGTLLLSQFLIALDPFLPYIIGVLIVGGGGLLVWKLFIKHRAVAEVAQTAQDAKVALAMSAPALEAAVFAAGGTADTEQSESTQNEVTALKKSGRVKTRRLITIAPSVPVDAVPLDDGLPPAPPV